MKNVRHNCDNCWYLSKWYGHCKHWWVRKYIGIVDPHNIMNLDPNFHCVLFKNKNDGTKM